MRNPIRPHHLAVLLLPTCLVGQQFNVSGREHAVVPTNRTITAVGEFTRDRYPDFIDSFGTLHIGSNGIYIPFPGRLSGLTLPGAGLAHLRAVDLDRDGRQDVVHVDIAGRAGVSYSTSSLFFSPSQALPSGGGSPRGLAIDDFDGDGDVDIYVSKFGSRGTLLLNSGNRQFVDASSNLAGTLPGNPSGVVAADVDGDGDLDLILPGEAGPALYVNDGSATFTDGTARAFPGLVGITTFLNVVDVDNDGDLDIATNRAVGRTNLAILQNDGSGRFVDVSATALPNQLLAAARPADVDSDGDQDLVTFDGRVLTNDGTGRFTLQAGDFFDRIMADLKVTDVDDDGDVDLVVDERDFGFTLLLGDDTGRFVNATPRTLEPTEPRLLADIDGDQDLDLVTVRGAHFNDGNGAFSYVAGIPKLGVVAAIDVDGDSDLDLVSSVALYLNDGTGTFTGGAANFRPQPPTGTTVAVPLDVDGDGDIDVFFGRGGPRDLLYLNDGTGVLTETSGRLPNRPAAIPIRSTAADVDGDGDQDIVLGAAVPMPVLLNDGAGRFTASQDLVRGGSAVASADLDGDGDDDLVTAEFELNNILVYVYRSQGGRLVEERVAIYPDLRTGGVTILDVDVDGDLDVAVTGRAAGSDETPIRLLQNDGSGDLRDVTLSFMGGAEAIATGAIAGDVDGDGDPDLIPIERLPRVLLNRHQQTSAPVLPRVGRNYWIEISVSPLYGAADSGALLLLSPRRGSTPTPFGELKLDPATLITASGFRLDLRGATRFDANIPANPALNGIELNWQTLALHDVSDASTWRLSNVVSDRILR